MSATDIVGGNNGVLQNGASFAPGKVGQAFSLDGVDDFVEVADAASLDISGAITIDAWINPDTLTTTSFQGNRIVDKVSVGGTDGYLLDALGDGAVSELRLLIGTETLFLSTQPLPTGTFTHIAGTYDGSEMKLYINGALDSTIATGVGAIPTNNLTLRIGADSNGDSTFDGLIDEVEIFDRALSGSEIQAIFDAGSAGKCKPVGGIVELRSSSADQGSEGSPVGGTVPYVLLVGLAVVLGAGGIFSVRRLRP